MFKLISRLLSYSLLFKYRRKIIFIVANLFIAILSIFIYADVVEFLKSNALSDYLIYALMLKWLIIILNILCIAYSLKPAKVQPKAIIKPIIKAPKSVIEEHIQKKPKLKSHGDMIIEEAKKKKEKLFS